MQTNACNRISASLVTRRASHQSSGCGSCIQHCAGRRRPSQQVALGRRRRHDYEEPEEYAQDQQYEQQYEQQFEQGVDPSPPIAEQGHRGVPLYISIPGALLVVFAAFRILKKLQSRGSVTGLVSRGLVNEDKGTNKGDPYYKDIMKHVNTMHMEELSDDQIAAARARRSKERDAPTIDIDKLDLPDNHPFAVKKKISKDEEELARKRMEVKRGLPLQDLSGKRGFPDDPRLAANEKMQAEAQKLDEQAARGREARLARQAAAQRQQQQQQQ